jgi:hypothetical protein
MIAARQDDSTGRAIAAASPVAAARIMISGSAVREV